MKSYEFAETGIVKEVKVVGRYIYATLESGEEKVFDRKTHDEVDVPLLPAGLYVELSIVANRYNTIIVNEDCVVEATAHAFSRGCGSAPDYMEYIDLQYKIKKGVYPASSLAIDILRNVKFSSRYHGMYESVFVFIPDAEGTDRCIEAGYDHINFYYPPLTGDKMEYLSKEEAEKMLPKLPPDWRKALEKELSKI